MAPSYFDTPPTKTGRFYRSSTAAVKPGRSPGLTLIAGCFRSHCFSSGLSTPTGYWGSWPRSRQKRERGCIRCTSIPGRVGVSSRLRNPPCEVSETTRSSVVLRTGGTKNLFELGNSAGLKGIPRRVTERPPQGVPERMTLRASARNNVPSGRKVDCIPVRTPSSAWWTETNGLP